MDKVCKEVSVRLLDFYKWMDYPNTYLERNKDWDGRNFYEMYLEEMELIRPLDQEEEKRVLAAAARADKEAGTVW